MCDTPKTGACSVLFSVYICICIVYYDMTLAGFVDLTRLLRTTHENALSDSHECEQLQALTSERDRSVGLPCDCTNCART